MQTLIEYKYVHLDSTTHNHKLRGEPDELIS
jgi:hypothetical protein